MCQPQSAKGIIVAKNIKNSLKLINQLHEDGIIFNQISDLKFIIYFGDHPSMVCYLKTINYLIQSFFIIEDDNAII